jgi:hypothetical protein
MWYVKDLLDRAQVAYLLWRLHRRRRPPKIAAQNN